MSAVPKPISVDDVSIDGRYFGGKSGEYHKSSMTAGNQEIIISPSGALNGQAQYNFNYIGNSGAAIDLSQSYILTSFTTTVNYYQTPYSNGFGQLNQPVTETTPIALAPGASDMLFQDAQLRLNNVDVGDTFAGQLGQTQFARKMMTKKAGWWGRPSLRLPCMPGGGGTLPGGTGRGGGGTITGSSMYSWGNVRGNSNTDTGQLPAMDVGVAGGMGAMAGYICDEPGFVDVSTGGYGNGDAWGTLAAGPASNGAAVRYQRLTGLGYSPAECVVHMAADPCQASLNALPVTCISTKTMGLSALCNSQLAYSMKKPILWGRQCTLRTNIPAGLADSAAFIPPGVSINLTLQNAPTSQWMIYDNYSIDRNGGHANHPWCIQQVNVNFTSVQLVLKTYTPSQLTSQSLAKAWALNSIIKLPHVRCRQWNTSFPGTVSSINQNILQGGTMPDLLVIAFGSGLGLGAGNAGISSVCWSPLSDQRDLQLNTDPTSYDPTLTTGIEQEITTQGAGGGQYIPNVQAINVFVNGKQVLTTPLGVASESYDDVRSYLSYVFAATGSYEPSDSPALSFAQWSKSCRLYCFNLRADQAPAGAFIPEDGAANLTVQAQLTPGSAVAPFLVGGSEPIGGPVFQGGDTASPGDWTTPVDNQAGASGYQLANAARAASRSNVAMYAFMFNLAEIEIDSTLQVKKTFGF